MAGAGSEDYTTYFEKLIEILGKQDMINTAKGIAKQVAYGAGGATIGGLLFGPAGALAGGMAGSLIGYMTSDDYQGMIKIIKSRSDSEKEELVTAVQGLVGSVLVDALVNFVESEQNRTALIEFILNLK